LPRSHDLLFYDYHSSSVVVIVPVIIIDDHIQRVNGRETLCLGFDFLNANSNEHVEVKNNIIIINK